MKLGAHLSVAGGFTNAINKATTIGGNCLQIFSCSPRSWSFTRLSDQQKDEFINLKRKLNISPIYFHASYLVNLANSSKGGTISKNSLIHELKLASQLGIKGSIIHLGSLKEDNPQTTLNETIYSYETLIDSIKEVIAKTPEDTLFIIENAGNKKIGQKIVQIEKIIKDVDSQRVRVCLDTCHLYSAGYDISSKTKLDNFIHMFDSLIGLKKLEVIHLNDSRDLLNTGRDRHENIGEGTLGLETFRLLLNHPKLKHVPFIIETPGFDKKGPDKQNLDILKSLL
jgi:deoxyribonuclease-4